MSVNPDIKPTQAERFFVTLASNGSVRNRTTETSWRFIGATLGVVHGIIQEDWHNDIWLVRVSSCQSFDHAEAIARDFLAFAQKHGIEVFQ